MESVHPFQFLICLGFLFRIKVYSILLDFLKVILFLLLKTGFGFIWIQSPFATLYFAFLFLKIINSFILFNFLSYHRTLLSNLISIFNLFLHRGISTSLQFYFWSYSYFTLLSTCSLLLFLLFFPPFLASLYS